MYVYACVCIYICMHIIYTYRGERRKREGERKEMIYV